MKTGLFVKLDASYMEDEDILEISDLAELLYVRALCRTMMLRTDGFLSTRQIGRIAPESGGESGGESGDLIEELERVGLWLKEGNGYRIRSWYQHNASVATVTAQNDDGGFGNHKRWHVRRGVVKDGCRYCRPDIAPISPPDSPPIRLPESLEVEVDVDVDVDVERSDNRIAPDSAPPKEANPVPQKSKAKRATPVPDTFEITPALQRWATENKVGVNLKAETERFLDYYRSRGQPMKDWAAAWRNWMRRAAEFSKGKPPPDDGLSPNPFFRMMQEEANVEKEGNYGSIVELDAPVRDPGSTWDYHRALGRANENP